MRGGGLQSSAALPARTCPLLEWLMAVDTSLAERPRSEPAADSGAGLAPLIELRHVSKSYVGAEGPAGDDPRRHQPRGARRRDGGAAGAIRVGQVHHPAPDGRAHRPDAGRGPQPRRARGRRQQRHRHRVPELCALPLAHRAGKRPGRAHAAAPERRNRSRKRSTGRWSSSACPATRTPTRSSSPAACASAWVWRARWWRSPKCCAWTSRSARSTS